MNPELKEKFIEKYLEWIKQNSFVNEIEKGKWMINSPFLDRHNDYLEIYVVEKAKDSFILTDDGFVYDDLLSEGCELSSPKRKEIFKLSLIGLGVNFNDKTHELYLETDFDNIGRNKHRMIQAMLSIGDMFMLSSSNVSSIFKEDVRAYFRRREVPFISDFKINGKSFIEHNIEIGFPATKNNPETMIKVINNPLMSNAKNAIFAFTDIKEIRKEIQGVVIYNDDQKISRGFVRALTAYKIESVAWSDREKYSDKILKTYEMNRKQ